MLKWRATPGAKSTYYLITMELEVTKTHDKNRGVDKFRWKRGNYFQTYEEARKYAKKVAEVLKDA